jgi:hypothetical protein
MDWLLNLVFTILLFFSGDERKEVENDSKGVDPKS